jgi:transcriptional regulator with XRE-family HTH domain
VTLEDFASALGLSPNLLEQLETNYSIPWSFAPSLMADVACLFRLHVKTLEILTRNSYDIAYFSGHMSDRESATRLMSSWLAEVRLELERREVEDLLD